MDYYNLAENHQITARILIDNGQHMDSVYHSCLAVEMYLKSKHSVLFPDSELSKSHDVIGISRDVLKQYPSSYDLKHIFISVRKYMNESRYPYNGLSVYTEDFAEDFFEYIKIIKAYIDNECQATLEDLHKRFSSKS